MTFGDLYGIKQWGKGYFDVNSEGRVIVKPDRKGISTDLFALTESLVARGIEAPFLLRFNGILKDRIIYLHEAFHKAIETFHYRGDYRIAFPIKVNPQKPVVEAISRYGKSYGIGLEVGSKPELLAVMVLEEYTESLLLCNGYKDAEYIELALLASKMGRRTIIIIEQMYELKMVFEIAKRLQMDAEIGFRLKLSSKGSGRWMSSGGDHAKFGLSSYELECCLLDLEKENKQHWLKLLHSHIGSQITSIKAIKKALQEASRLFVEMHKRCPTLGFFDAGGGLAVDYDGTNSQSDSSMNYSVEEYARDVVSTIGEACLQAGIDDPTIITESGRSLTAHHAILINEVIDVTSMTKTVAHLNPPPSEHDILMTLYDLYEKLKPENTLETLHDAVDLKEKILEQFLLGQMTLKERAWAERVCSLLITKICRVAKSLPYVPEDIRKQEENLYETYFCNFSVFQSLPDAWAIGQLFPIMPIHRLNEEPTHKAQLADLSCDSDGKVDCFVGKEGKSKFLKLHEYSNGPYYLGIFLVGAYQEIMGGLHNLFGDTNVVHVDLDEEGQWKVLQVVEGDTMEDVLCYAQYNPDELFDHLRQQIDHSLKLGKLQTQDARALQKQFKQSLENYTYLVV